MKCPHCQTTDLLLSTRSDIEIDYCPQCRGVWLDRGELDKIIERSNRMDEQRYRGRDDDDDDDDDDDKRRRYQQGYGGAPYPNQPPPPPYPNQPYPNQQYGQPYYKKKKSFWSELFD